MSGAIRLPVWPALAPVAPAIALALAGLALLFTAEIGAAVHVWDTSTAYGHCWLVLPIVAWLIHERRFQAAAVPSRPAWWPALLALPLAAFWIVADLLGVMEGRQIALIGFIELALLAALGWRQWVLLSPALLYLIFLVPFGAFLTTILQHFTAGFVQHGLDILGVPNRVTEFQIEIPEGTFYVAEACAGLRFLIASIAFGALYAITIFRSPWRRIAFIGVSCVVPVLANGVRALGIVMLGHALGSAEAAAADHVLYGWVFFAIVILLLALCGMPFRQDQPLVRVTPAAPLPHAGRTAMLTILPVLLVAALGPLASLALDARAQAEASVPSILIAPPDCAVTEIDHAGAVLTQTFKCGESTLVARTELLPRQANPSRVMRAATDWATTMVPGPDTDNRILRIGRQNPTIWHLLVDETSPRAAASLMFVDGKPALGGLHDRLHLAADLLNGHADAPVALTVAMTGGDANPGEVLGRFLSGQGDLEGRVGAASKARGSAPGPR
jgi:exosortase A